MKLTSYTHYNYVVRDDRGNTLDDVTEIDTDEMTLTRYVRNNGKLEYDASGIARKTYRLLAFRFEAGNVVRVQVGKEIE